MNAAERLITSVVGSGPRFALHPPRNGPTPERQHDNIRTVTIGGDEFRMSRGERKKLARMLTVQRVEAELRGEIIADPKYLSSAQRQRQAAAVREAA